MMKTEAEAKTCWCPMAQVAFGHMGTGNRVDMSYAKPESDDRAWLETKSALCRCIASACMAWRSGPVPWPKREYAEDRNAVTEPARPASVPPSWEWRPADLDDGCTGGWLEPESEARQRQVGYCGLAGAPS